MYLHRKKESEPAAKKLPAVPESVLKRRKTREAVRAARLQISIKVLIKYLINIFFKNIIFNYLNF